VHWYIETIVTCFLPRVFGVYMCLCDHRKQNNDQRK